LPLLFLHGAPYARFRDTLGSASLPRRLAINAFIRALTGRAGAHPTPHERERVPLVQKASPTANVSLPLA